MQMLKICWVLISFQFLHYIQIESKHLNGALSSKPLRWGSLRKATSSFVTILTTFAKNLFRKSTYPIFDFGYWLLCILDTSVSKIESASNHFKDVQLFSLTFYKISSTNILILTTQYTLVSINSLTTFYGFCVIGQFLVRSHSNTSTTFK